MNKWQKKMDAAFRKMEAIRAIAEKENRSLTPEELQQRADLKVEIEKAKREWDDFKTEEELRSQLYGDGSTGALTHSDAPHVEIPDAPVYRGSSASVLGSQLLDIAIMSNPAAYDSQEVVGARSRLERTEKRNQVLQEARLHKENRAAATGGFTVAVPTDGGFFLQGETATELMTTGFNNSEVLSRCSSRTFGPGTQFLEIYGIDEQSRVNGSRGGGIRVYTAAELDEFTASKTQFKKVRIEPKKLTGLYHASGEIIRNVTFLGQEMRQLFGEEFAFKCQDLVVRGTGVGEPLGILNAGCLVTQAKLTNQAADTIKTDNILQMEVKLMSESPSTVWLVNRETKPQLSVLSITIGTGGIPTCIYSTVSGPMTMDNMTGKFYMGKRQAFLNGIPCITIEQAAALGDLGDIILADLSQYVTANKGDINEAMSIHVNFIYDQQTFRFLYYFDGQPRWATAITPYKGAATSKVSPFIVLAARA